MEKAEDPAELREVCGFDPLKRDRAVAPDYVLSRFFALFERHADIVCEMFQSLVASAADSPRLVPLVESYRRNRPSLAERGKTVSADKAYDSGSERARLYERHGLALISMLATARSWIEHEHPEHMRRILCAA